MYCFSLQYSLCSNVEKARLVRYHCDGKAHNWTDDPVGITAAPRDLVAPRAEVCQDVGLLMEDVPIYPLELE